MGLISSKASAQKALSDTAPEHFFYVCDGTVIKNLEELHRYLQAASPEVYGYHVTAERNDFFSWINEIIADTKLAKDIAKAKNQKAAVAVLKERIKFLKQKAK